MKHLRSRIRQNSGIEDRTTDFGGAGAEFAGPYRKFERPVLLGKRYEIPSACQFHHLCLPRERRDSSRNSLAVGRPRIADVTFPEPCCILGTPTCAGPDRHADQSRNDEPKAFSVPSAQ
jgi:hypothetical protein